jgi:DNA primase large subunit
LEEITLDEFETYALDRLQLLRALEALRGRGLGPEELQQKMMQMEAKYMPLRAYTAHAEDSRKDLISHFILRLAYCRRCVAPLSSYRDKFTCA